MHESPTINFMWGNHMLFRIIKISVVFVIFSFFSGCGNSGSPDAPPSAPIMYSIGASVIGLPVSDSVSLQLNGSESYPMTSNTSFTFATALPDGSDYVVSVAVQPSTVNYHCKVTNGTGTLAGANVTDITVDCRDVRAPLAGKFTTVTEENINQPTYMAVGDLNGDGFVDMIRGNGFNFSSFGPQPTKVYLNNGTGVLVDTTQSLGSSATVTVALADLDMDGDLDLVAGNRSPTSSIGVANTVWFNNGSGYFSSNGQSLGSSNTDTIALGDVDGDGDIDIVAGNNNSRNNVWLNDGAGYFSQGFMFAEITTTASIKLADLDGDGDLDLVEGNLGSLNRVYINDGEGVFTNSGQSINGLNTHEVEVGDVDNDGDLDIVIGNEGNNYVYLNTGGGLFADSGQAFGELYVTTTIDLVDIDKDGDLDLIEGRSGGNAARVYVNNGTGIYTDSGQLLPQHQKTTDTVIADIDGDLDPDIVMSNINFEHTYFINNGDGFFTGSTQRIGLMGTGAVALADVDGDGDEDLVTGEYTTSTSNTNRLHLNDGHGNFTQSQTIGAYGTYTSDMIFGDVDTDGDLDLVIGNFQQANEVWLNNGSGVFTNSGQSLGTNRTSSIALADVDADGDIDIVEGNSSEGNKIWLNNGSGVFADSGQSLGTSGTSSIAVADLDGDGDLDFAEGVGPSGNRIWFNNGSGVFTVSGQVLGAYKTLSISLADVDNDGDMDLVAGNSLQDKLTAGGSMFVEQDSRLYLNNGNGVFTDSGQSLGLQHTFSVQTGDIDNDGDQDIVMGNYQQPGQVLLNNGSGVFSDSGQGLSSAPFIGSTSTYSIKLSDIDMDGDLDIVEGNGYHSGSGLAPEPNRVYVNLTN